MTAPLVAAAVFLLLLLTRFVDPALITRDNEYVLSVVLQLMIFLIPATVYMKLAGTSLADLKLSPVGINHILLVISASLAVSAGTFLLDYAAEGYGAISRPYDLYGIFVSKNDGGVGSGAYLALAYAAIPAFCEELVFRGLLCSEYEKKGVFAAVFMPALFFAMMHFEAPRFFSFFFAGVMLSLTAYAARSIFASMTVHFICNMISVFGVKYLQTLYDLGGGELFVFIVTVIFLFSSFVFAAECARLYRAYSAKGAYSPTEAYKVRRSARREDSAIAKIAGAHPAVADAVQALFAPAAIAVYVLFAIGVLI